MCFTLPELIPAIRKALCKSPLNIMNVKPLLVAYKGDDWISHVSCLDNRKVLHEEPLFDVVLRRWPFWTTSGFHDHPANGCLFKVLQGVLFERIVTKNSGNQQTQMNIPANTIRYISNDDGIHCIEAYPLSMKDCPPVSLHIYCPGIYKPKLYTFVKNPYSGKISQLHRTS